MQILSFRLGWALRQCPLWTFDISSSLVQSYEPDGKLESWSWVGRMSWWTACSRMLKYVGRAFYRYQADGQGPLTVSVEDVTLSKVDSPLYMSHGAIFLLSCADIYIYISQISYPAFAIQIQYHCVCFVHCTAVPRMPSEETGPLDMRCEALHELSPPTCIAWLWQQVWYVWVRAPRSLSPAIFLPRPHTYTHTHLQTHLNTYISSTSTTSTRTCWTSRSSRTSRS